jgi:hypothetical protein
MNEHEEKTVESFILREKRHRYKYLLDHLKKRAVELDRLNHCSDLDPRWTIWLQSNTDVVELLRNEGSPKDVYLISSSTYLDGRTMILEKAIEECPMKGWGTIVSCIPGRLVYYYDECGERRALLKKEI